MNLLLNQRAIESVKRTPAYFWGYIGSEIQAMEACDSLADKTVPDEEGDLYRRVNDISVRRGTAPKPFGKFADVFLPRYLIKAIIRNGFEKPTAIQAQAWPIAIAGINFIGIAPMSSGKTLAYLLPIILFIEKSPVLRYGEGPLALILLPTHELAQQVYEVVEEFCRTTTIKSVCVFGGGGDMQINMIRIGPDIVIATPGRLISLVRKGFIDLSLCKFVVLDEADRLLDLTFQSQIKTILAEIPPNRQLFMCSATWSKTIANMAEDFIKNYIHIEVNFQKFSPNFEVTQIARVFPQEDKYEKLLKLLRIIYDLELNLPPKILIFAKTIDRVEELKAKLCKLPGVKCGSIHSKMTQRERDDMLENFKGGVGKSNILIATGLMGRGLYMRDLKYIIIYDYPGSMPEYMQRIGLVGLDCNGTSYTFLTPSDARRAKKLFQYLRNENQFYNHATRKSLPGFSKLEDNNVRNMSNRNYRGGPRVNNARGNGRTHGRVNRRR